MKILPLLFLAASAAAHAATYELPDPAVQVTPNYGNTTTIVTIAGVTYRGPSAFYYLRECDKADGPKYHCDVMAETNVLLTEAAVPHRTVRADMTAQFSGTLITSGHNYWRYSQILTSGEVRTP